MLDMSLGFCFSYLTAFLPFYIGLDMLGYDATSENSPIENPNLL